MSNYLATLPGPIWTPPFSSPSLMAAVYNAVSPAVADGQMVALQTDNKGNLLVSATFSGTISGNAAASATGAAVPAAADYIGFNSGGNLVGVSAGNPLPITGSISATNPSVSTNGAAIPTSSTQIGWKDGSGNLQPVSAANPLPISGSITASNPSVGATGSGTPTSATLLGASDGTNLNALLVESASHANLRVSLYNGATEATVTAGNALKVDGSAVTQPVSIAGSVAVTGTFFQATQPVSGTVTANQGTAAALAAGWPTVSGMGASTTQTWTSSSATTLTLTCSGYSVVEFSINLTPSITSGTLNVEVSDDGGTTWYSGFANSMAGSAGFSSTALASIGTGIYQVSVAGCTNFRLRKSGSILGAGNIVFTAQAIASSMAPGVSVINGLNLGFINGTTITTATSGMALVGVADGSGNALTSNSTTPSGKRALDTNIISILGTAPTTVGKLDIKGADGDVFVRQATAANLNATIVGTGTLAVQNTAATPAGTNLIGQVSASNETSTVYNGTTALTPLFATVVASASGVTNIIAAVSSKKIRVLALQLVANGAVNVKWQSHVTPTDLTGLAYLAANGGYVLPYNPVGWFQTVSGEALDINLSGAVAVGGSITYVTV